MMSQVAFWKHEPVADQASETLAANTLRFYQQTLGDMVKLTPAGNYQIADRGGEAQWCNDPLGRRTFVKRFIVKPDDWYKLTDQVTALEQQIVQAAQLTRQRLPKKVPLYVTLFSPMTLALMLAGPERLIAHLHSAPAAVNYAIKQLLQSAERLLSLYQQVDVAGYFIANQHAAGGLLSEQDYLNFAKDSDDRILRSSTQLGDTILHLHGHGVLTAALPTHSAARVHYELDATNPSPEQFRAISQCSAVIGLPLDVWRKPASYKAQTRLMLERFAQPTALFTSPCVLPLNLANTEVQHWITAMRLALA
ncbi:hypothetical protein LMJ53_00855 [Rheinheimera sp. UJ51]|uniref:uroporphyrinogen decarboxylase family protein n=1 Tax=Rheinheimera sp. UJ51 TaxID=2892446 RepID=UPI001E589B51|nr:uroporphyrinogen decarboxylase family protein [Rheinheimera sp. UJ51]MCC5450283.1 hypothetical protein [Rheinheimera sp. UJ51]